MKSKKFRLSKIYFYKRKIIHLWFSCLQKINLRLTLVTNVFFGENKWWQIELRVLSLIIKVSERTLWNSSNSLWILCNGECLHYNNMFDIPKHWILWTSLLISRLSALFFESWTLNYSFLMQMEINKCHFLMKLLIEDQ